MSNKVIGKGNCGGCEAPVDVKLNKNDIAYYYCSCGHHERFSRAQTAKLTATTEENGNAELPAATKQPEQQPADKREPEQSGDERGGSGLLF